MTTLRSIFPAATAVAVLAASLTGAGYAAPSTEPTTPTPESALHTTLPEQYLSVKAPEPWTLQRTFTVASRPRVATLYVSAPSDSHTKTGTVVSATLNGHVVLAVPAPRGGRQLVLVRDVTADLQTGTNTLSIQTSSTGDVAAKIVPAPVSVMAPALVITDNHWTANGPISDDGSVESYQYLLGNHDANMYRWAGYDGISPYLTRHEVVPAKHFADSLDAASTVFDFGREYAGRVYVVSHAAVPVRVAIAYGESLDEAEQGPYLGVKVLVVPAHGVAYGPKSAFRYAVVRYFSGSSAAAQTRVALDAILYPVKYYGSFASSDPLLNRIWSVGAYTSLLCMQDTIWDAPKRDREPWVGDLNVSGLVIDDVFADRFLMRKTLDVLIDGADSPVDRDVNSIPGYSAFWVMDLTDYYRHTADRAYVMSKHDQLVQLLAYMQTEMTGGVFTDAHKAWGFVDWSPQYDGYSPTSQSATDFEFIKAFADASWLLRQEGDVANARRYAALVASMRTVARTQFANGDTYGNRWQGNAFAVLSGVAQPTQFPAIWGDVLSQPSAYMITPYYNYYVISAMAATDHRSAALNWIRRYWGGMIKEGATTFWEGYDPSWPKQHFHQYLQADDTHGYVISLSHGWSSGPTAWLMSQILGIRPEKAGFARTAIRPDLAGLAWARGTEPTPHGIIHVGYRGGQVFTAQIQLPAGVVADVSMPVTTSATVTVNGHPAPSEASEHGKRRVVVLTHAGTYALTSR